MGATLSGVVNSDDVSLVMGSASFATKDTGTAKVVTVIGSTITGTGSGNYTLTELNGLTSNITAYPITVTADAKTIIQGDTDISLTYTATSLLVGDTWGGELVRTAGDTAGSYQILMGTLSASSNYSITFEGADYVIAPIPAMTNPVVLQVPFMGLASACVYNLQGQQVWSGVLNVNFDRFVMPNIGAGAWVVKLQLGNTIKYVNMRVRK